jgi:hypothetical protein
MSKVTFDGANRRIYVNNGVTDLNIKLDVYSAWKNWVLLSDNAKYPQALRTIGGDPIGPGLFLGDYYFLQNNWQIETSEIIVATGNIFNDVPGLPVWVINPGGGVTNLVSSLTTTVLTGGGSPLTASQIRQEIDLNSTRLLSIENKSIDIQTATSVLDTKITNLPSNIRSELTPEITKLMSLQNGLTPDQAIMLTEIYRMYGLDPTRPLVVTNTSRSVGSEIYQDIMSAPNTTTITRS